MFGCKHRKFAIVLFITVLFRNCAARKSKEKCKEYADLVYENEQAPILSINSITNRVSRCAIIETPLIVGGVRAKPAEFPHMAIIGYGKDDDVAWQCGGSIISDNFILTAAHCLTSPNKGPATKVRVGLINLLDPGDFMQERKIAENIKHTNYNHVDQYHDIGLIRLVQPLKLNSQVRPACLEINSQTPGNSAIASGFGSNTGSKQLMKVQLNYISESDCKRGYIEEIGTRLLPQGLISSLLCAGIMEGGKDTCQGDSGGPLQRVLTEPYCMYSIVGITSFGKFCAFKSTPGVYTRVSSYLDWIESIVWR